MDRSRFYTISQLSEDMPYVQVRGYIRDVAVLGEKQGKRVVANFYDATGSPSWFGLKAWPGSHAT